MVSPMCWQQQKMYRIHRTNIGTVQYHEAVRSTCTVVRLVPQNYLFLFNLNLSHIRLDIQLKKYMLRMKWAKKAWSHWLLLVSEAGGDRCSVSWLSLVQIIVMKAARTSVMLAAFFLWEYVEDFSRDLRDTWFFPDPNPVTVKVRFQNNYTFPDIFPKSISDLNILPIF
jgi:hypothetical protein